MFIVGTWARAGRCLLFAVASLGRFVQLCKLCFGLLLVGFVLRYSLPIIFLVVNNNGIFRGVSSSDWKDAVTSDNDHPGIR